jgi:SAM-dependent methyltransferase
MTNTVKNENSGVYYSAKYWSNIPYVLEYICENITGNKNKWWVADFKERFCQKPFNCALSLNCGNGWVERELIDLGIARRFVAFDYSKTLLNEAEANRGDRNISYFQADVNQIDFKPDQFDLIVDVAALHHVQYINRLSVILCKTLKKDGYFVAYDYVGPERNQYPLLMWFWINRFNKILPVELRRTKLSYAHIPTMLAADPTEAIHSDLIIETMKRYFDVFECHDAGGGIAYEILSQNPNIDKVSLESLKPYIDRILEIDKKYTTEKKVPSLFSYFIARPAKERIADIRQTTYFQNLENKRENLAYKREGVYHFHQIVQMKFHHLFVYLLRKSSLFSNFINYLKVTFHRG